MELVHKVKSIASTCPISEKWGGVKIAGQNFKKFWGSLPGNWVGLMLYYLICTNHL